MGRKKLWSEAVLKCSKFCLNYRQETFYINFSRHFVPLAMFFLFCSCGDALWGVKLCETDTISEKYATYVFPIRGNLQRKGVDEQWLNLFPDTSQCLRVSLPESLHQLLLQQSRHQKVPFTLFVFSWHNLFQRNMKQSIWHTSNWFARQIRCSRE